MKEHSKTEMEQVQGGWIPLIVGAAKLIATGIGALTEAGAVVYGVGYYDGKRECEEVCATDQN